MKEVLNSGATSNDDLAAFFNSATMTHASASQKAEKWRTLVCDL